jgi:hypothetical protein
MAPAKLMETLTILDARQLLKALDLPMINSDNILARNLRAARTPTTPLS